MALLLSKDFLWAGPNLGEVSIDQRRLEGGLQLIHTPLMSLGVIRWFQILMSFIKLLIYQNLINITYRLKSGFVSGSCAQKWLVLASNG
jgi:hypothetical protein